LFNTHNDVAAERFDRNIQHSAPIPPDRDGSFNLERLFPK
jgi:hypothetical protein